MERYHRFYTPQEISKMEPGRKWTIIFSIGFIMSLGFMFEIFFILRGVPFYISVLPFYGFTLIAWERKDETI